MKKIDKPDKWLIGKTVKKVNRRIDIMKKIDKPDKWLIGKTVKKVDARSVNGTTFYFADGTAMWLEAGPQGYGIYGPVYYEIDPSKPVHEQ